MLPRLLPHARRLGLVSGEDYSRAMRSEERLRRAEGDLAAVRIVPDRSTREEIERLTGVRVGEALTSFSGILTGVPKFVGESAELLNNRPGS